MSAEQIKYNIQEAIQSFAKGNVTELGINLFEKLGYSTERRASLGTPTFVEFKETYIYDKKFDEAKALVNEWLYVDLLFQLSREELTQQGNLFDTKQVDRTIIETYLFFAIELKREEYTRTELSNITREINRLFPMPAMLLFKHGQKITFSVINRRLHKRDESKDVLEKVTLIKDISIENPLRAHIEILFDLSFKELLAKHQFTNFVELHNAWQKTLDTKELNKRFYNELFNWYLWAVQSVSFPNDVNDDKDDTVYNAESVIRLLTRLIFVWFIKEKNLVPQALFNAKNLKTLLKDFQPESEKSSVYYRAILQNLFFATLNTPMDKDITDENRDEKRRFINTLPKTSNDHYLDQTKYRYRDYFLNPDNALELFSTIPFLNGGLFECLDFKEGNKEIRFDGFSSTEKRQAFVPDKLFFAKEFQLDLNSEHGTKGKRYMVEGIINILDSYKFTITENTPLEEEIALDPELLGKVFENLLASYNPETQTTARKQTGSFYTPREIVNYMVDESLLAYFKQKLGDSTETEEKLRLLFTNAVDLPSFTKTESDSLIKAISEVKILDPACGSGAFPMGVLHRLVDLLSKLDPENKSWNELQKQRAIAETAEVFESGDTEERRIRLDEINKAFDLSMNYPDYARKLFLIENCIYGVDIQQVAIQISKLRFFISLIVDQKVDNSKPNRNILSMPNLETKFVAANTLIGLDKPQQRTFMADDVERLEKELAAIRRKIFFTRKYSEKRVLKKKEKAKREELQAALTQSGYTVNVAAQMAGWNPFDPMQSAKFFDPETMFGFNHGFDVVIGNPPYGFRTVLSKKEKDYFRKIVGIEFSSGDSAELFCKISFDKLVKQKGILTFIIPKKSLYGDAWEDMRLNYWKKYDLAFILDTGKSFENVLLEASVFGLIKSSSNRNVELAFLESDLSIQKFENTQKEFFFLENNTCQIYKVLYPVPLFNKIKKNSFETKKITTKLGLAIGQEFFSETKTEHKLLKGIDVEKYNVRSHRYLKNYQNLKWESVAAFQKPKIITQVIVSHIEYPNPHLKIISCYDAEGIAITNTLMAFEADKDIDLKFLLGYLNSKFVSWYAYNFIYTQAIRTMHFYDFYIQQLPIPKVEIKDQQTFITLVDQILAAKKADPKADTSALEKQIDELVYQLYELTEEEIAIIEGRN